MPKKKRKAKPESTDFHTPITEAHKPAWMSLFLQTTVHAAIVEIQRRGGPTDQDFADAVEFGYELGERADKLMYQEEDTHKMATRLAYAVAVASFVPGGVTVLGVRYEARCQPT